MKKTLFLCGLIFFSASCAAMSDDEKFNHLVEFNKLCHPVSFYAADIMSFHQNNKKSRESLLKSAKENPDQYIWGYEFKKDLINFAFKEPIAKNPEDKGDVVAEFLWKVYTACMQQLIDEAGVYK